MPLTEIRKTHAPVRADPTIYSRNEIPSPLDILRSARNIHTSKKTPTIKKTPDNNIKTGNNQSRFISDTPLMEWK
jgi:hypothetical protein